MKLSVIIVNYNVSAFLEQALASAVKAMRGIDGEIFVVDNHSVDNSVAMVKMKFPQVKLIENQENVGFAKANNQAIQISSGEYVLLLNPDTLVEEDTFEKCLRFMDETPDCGGLGVKMVDGQGRFLPESKRGIPYPKSSFYKLFGLSKLFPKSKKFGAYHATYIGEDETHDVEVLSGAFMMMRKSVLDHVGLLDEDYFMYGEDIDLSYRILKGGYKKIFNVAIDAAIWFRAALAALKRIVSRILLPVLDFILIYAGLFALSKYWEHTVLLQRNSSFSDFYFNMVLPGYALLWLTSVWISGGYRKPVKRTLLNRGIVAGTVVILLIYALLPETMRFSRAVVVIGAVWALFAVNALRYLLSNLKLVEVDNRRLNQRIAIVGGPQDTERVLGMVQSMNEPREFVGLVMTERLDNENRLCIGRIDDLSELLTIYQINEVIFCARDIPADQIIDWMNRLQDMPVEFKIAPEDSSSLIGSNAIFTTEDLYTIPLQTVYQQQSRRRKRSFDIIASFVLLLFLWADIWFVKRKDRFVRNIFEVFCGKKSWVGLHELVSDSEVSLRPGVLYPADAYPNSDFSEEMTHRLEEIYARNYQIRNDLTIMVKGCRQLGR